MGLPINTPMRLVYCDWAYNIAICIAIGHLLFRLLYRYRNRNLGISRTPLKSQAHQDTSLFTNAATNQRGCPKGSEDIHATKRIRVSAISRLADGIGSLFFRCLMIRRTQHRLIMSFQLVTR